MRRIPESEIESDFERQYAWGDDERHLYNRNKKKASVMGFFLRLETVISLVREFSPGPRVADFASAQGNFSLMLSESGFDVTAVDIQPGFLKYAKKKHTHGNFDTVQANIIEYRSEKKYDCVILGEVIEHVAHPDQLLTSAYENLVKGGVLILTTPNGGEFGQSLPTYQQVKDRLQEFIPRQFHWGDHLFLYTEDELRELMSSIGFEVLKVQKLNSSYVTQIKGVRYILPLPALKWIEKKTRGWKKHGRDSTNSLIVVAKKK